MKKHINKIKMQIARDGACINTTVVIICAAVCAVLGIIFAIGGIDSEVYEEIIQPKFYLPLFFMVLFNIIFYALLGAGAGIIISTPYYGKNQLKPISLFLAATVLLLCYAWIPLVYTAKSFLIATFIYVIVLLFFAVIFRMYMRISRIAAWMMLIFSVFALYMIFYSFTLFVIN